MQTQNPEIYFVTIIGIILGLLLVGFIVTILLLYQRRQQRQEQEMEKIKDMYEKEALRSQLEIQENTFKAIAQELHDNIGQMLSVAKLSLSVLPVTKDHAAWSPLQSSQQILNKAIGDLSNLTKGLYTDRISQVGLAESIKFEVYALKTTGLVKVQFYQEGSEINFNEQNSIFLFRIFQEALNNTLKHAKATEVIVNLKYEPEVFTLALKDNGIGFDLAQKQQSATSYSGVGLKSMFNRAKLIGATISINSEVGAGTLILIQASAAKGVQYMTKTEKYINVAIADDHSLLRNALANLINSFEGYRVVMEADNGRDLSKKITQSVLPDIVLVDVNMPEMDGFETTQWLFKKYPQIKVLALSMLSDERTIIKIFRLGAKGYLLKNTDPTELKTALDSVMNKNVYLSEYVSGKLVSGLHNDTDAEIREAVLNEKEREFLRWTCTELSYKEIAEKMFLSPRTIDDYRQSLFSKLKVHSRVGLVLYAIRNGIAEA